MNLTKSFNKEFFLEMIKKSKGIVIFSIIIMPLLLSMYIILTAIDTKYSIVFDTNITSAISIGMYVLPLFYSSVFFGYVFRKKSIDFMGSLPINRKTIFVTGTIGGILLMLLIHLIMLVLIFFYGFVFRNVVVIPAAIFDGMIMSFLGFVFVYTATNLAMTFTGTFLTQVLVTAIILVIVPISTMAFKEIGELNLRNDYEIEDYNSYSYYSRNNYDLLVEYDGEELYYKTKDANPTYTLPFNTIVGNSDFSYIVIIKMIVLSIAYSMIGYKIFKKRNMENTGQSVGSNRAHIILKAFALYPFVLLFNLFDMYTEIDATSLVTPLIIFGILYYVFDYIIKRKIPFKTTVVAYVGSLIVLQMIVGSVRIFYRPSIKELDADNIKSISIGESSQYSGLFENYIRYYLSNDANFDKNYYIEDEEFIELVLSGLVEKKDKDNNQSTSYSIDYYEYDYGNNISLNLKTNTGKVYSITGSISSQTYKSILEYLNEDEEYQERLAKQIKKKKSVYYIDSYRPLGIKETKILDSIVDDIEKFDYINGEETITKQVYSNHKIREYYIPVRLLEEYEEWDNIKYRSRTYEPYYY